MCALNIRARSTCHCAPEGTSGLTDRLESFVADGRTERDADLPSPSARQPRPERIAEEVELLVGIVATSVIILAIDDFRLLGMKCQSTFSKPFLKRDAQGRSLFLTATVTDRIVGIALEGNARMVPVHPHIERVMQKKICKDGAYNPTLWRPSFPHGEATIRHLHRCFQPSLDVQQHPWTVRMFTDCSHKQSRLDTVKEGLDVEIKDPGVAPASLPRDAHSIERRFAGPVSIGVVMEMRLHEWLQNPFDHHLGDSIGDRWNTKRPRSSSFSLWDVNPSHRRRKVAARRHSIPDLVEVVRQISLEVRNRLAVHASRTLVGSDLPKKPPLRPGRHQPVGGRSPATWPASGGWRGRAAGSAPRSRKRRDRHSPSRDAGRYRRAPRSCGPWR